VEVRAGVFKDTCLSFPDQVNERGRSPAWWPRGGNVAGAHGFLSGTLLDHGDTVSPDFEGPGDDLA
jgi:hypothetical protein